MVHSVSSWFYEQSISKNPKVLRRCFIGSEDVSQYMKKWPSIKRDHTKLRPGNISINLANEDQTFNNFIADTLNLTKSIQLDLGFGGNPAVVDKLQGYWMASNTEETLVGKLVTDGTLDTACGVNWTCGAGWSIGSGVATKTAGTASVLEQPISVTVGKKYVVSLEVKNYVAGQVLILANTGIFRDRSLDIVTADGVYTWVYEETHNGNLRIWGDASFDGDVDNVSVRATVTDVHTTDNGLGVYGTIEKEPAATNAKVMGYSAFTGSAYLEQAYNAALDPGTDIWAYIGWAKSTDIISSELIFSRGHYTVSWSGSLTYLAFNSVGGLTMQVSDDGGASNDIITVNPKGGFDDNAYHLLSCLRVESAFNFYIDKTLVGSTAVNFASASLTNSLATLRYGFRQDDTRPATNATLAMWSAIIGAVPTAYDIGNIYDNEIGYLQPGGKEAPDDWVSDRFNQVGEFLTVYEGGIGSISFAKGLAKINAEDKFNPLSHRVIGSRDAPVLMTDSFLPSDVFWTICTCYGGLSSVESTSNPDIDWAAFQTWAAVFSADSVFVSAKYEGDNCVKALRSLAHYTQSTIVTDPAKITPNRFSGIVTGNELFFDDSSIIDNTVVISEQTIINRQYVSGDYDTDASSYGITVVKADSVSINSFGLHADTMEETSIWYINSLSAINLADRKISFNKTPSTAYRIELPLVPLTRQIGDIITVADSSLSVASHSMRMMGYSINMDKCAMSLSGDDSQLANPFLLDVSTLDGPDLLL
jgi:hypothetical protein